MLRRRSLWILALLVLAGLLPLTAGASYLDNPPAQPGFTHTPFNAGDTDRGLRLAGAEIRYSSPTIADIDGDTANGKEIVVGGSDGLLYAYHKDGTQVWPPVNVLGGGSCNYVATVEGLINGAPAVGELFDDGVPYVVVGYGNILQVQPPCPGGVAAFDGRNGQLEWRYSLNKPGEALHGVFSSPALADVDGDGKLEVGFGNYERDILMLTHDGKLLWRYHNADTVWSSPAFADVDGDGNPDMIIGSDITADPPLGIQNGGYVTAFRGSGKNVDPATKTETEFLWRNFYNQAIWSSPVVADLDGNGTTEVIIGSGCFDGDATGDGRRDQFPEVNGHWIQILNLSTGAQIRQLNAAGCISSIPAVGDVNGDGKLDIVAGVRTYQSGTGSSTVPPTVSAGIVQAWTYDNVNAIWSSAPQDPPAGLNDPTIGNYKSTVIADVDGNGSLEVLVGNQGNVAILRGSDGAQLSCKDSGCGSLPTLKTWSAVHATPAVGDLDDNGKLEVVIGGAHSDMDPQKRGYLYVWTNIPVLSAPGSAPPNFAPWPMFHGNPSHTGVVPALVASSKNIAVLVKLGASAKTLAVEIKNIAGDPINWTATKDQAWITLNPALGTTPETINITLDPAGLGLGSYTGSVSISSPLGSLTINTTMLVVDEIYQINLPLARR